MFDYALSGSRTHEQLKGQLHTAIQIISNFHFGWIHDMKNHDHCLKVKFSLLHLYTYKNHE